MPVQNHIHLSDTIGSAPENAPDLTWKVTERVIVPSFTVDIVQGLTGVRFDYAIEDTTYQDVVYDILLHDTIGYSALDQLEDLIGLAGKRLYLCDSVHADDGADHTSDVKLVRMSKMGEIPNAHLLLQIFRVQIFLSRLTT